MKKLIYITSIFTLLICCNQIKTETIIIDKDSEELVYLIELSTKDNSHTDVEDFTQSIRKEDLNEEIETLGGFIVSIAGRVPVKGEVIKYSPSGLKFEILEADPRKVILVKITGFKNMTYLNKLKL